MYRMKSRRYSKRRYSKRTMRKKHLRKNTLRRKKGKSRRRTRRRRRSVGGSFADIKNIMPKEDDYKTVGEYNMALVEWCTKEKNPQIHPGCRDVAGIRFNKKTIKKI